MSLSICLTVLAILVGAFLWKKSQAKPIKLNVRTPTATPNNEGQAKTIPSIKVKPEKWVKVGRVKKLLLYPVKSCAGVELDQGKMTMLGLESHNSKIRDRHFMVVDENGKYVPMTKYPRMALIKFEILEGDKLTVTAPDMPPFTFTFPNPTDANRKFCRLFHDPHMKALDCGDETAQWFQEYLGDSSLRLYYHHLNNSQRTFEQYMYKCPQFELSDMGAFQNETAFLLCAEESITELNKHLDKDSSWKNWRPSILIDQVAEPFAEVNWSFVKIGNGSAILKAAAPCKRCPLVTVDHDLGEMPADGEPLKTLKELYGSDLVVDRRMAEVYKSKGIMGTRFGVYLPAGEGHVIKVGDPVYVALL